MQQAENALLERGYTRRDLVRIAVGCGAGLPLWGEYAMAQLDKTGNRGIRRSPDSQIVAISANENPMGPPKEGIDAMSKVGPSGWRFNPPGDNRDFDPLLASIEDVPQDHVAGYAGSSRALHQCVLAFCSPTRSLVECYPGYNVSILARFIGAKTIRVPLRGDYSHDTEGMVRVGQDAGAYFVCNPNNPTGTLTPRRDFAHILANKPKDAVLIVDEAYAHYTDLGGSSIELVKEGRDVVVLRTFSKIYGMAGLRAGALYGRPDLLAMIAKYGDNRGVSVTAASCAAASMKNIRTVLPERTAINRRNRDFIFEHLDKAGVSYIASTANFFMMSVKGMSGAQVASAMSAKKVEIASRRWPEWPQHVRVTVGSMDDMRKFAGALDEVIKEGPVRG